jgi:predicted neuraminidase
VANGIESPTVRYPTWNPVLFQPEGGPLTLYYKVGPNPDQWWGMVMASPDEGKTWGQSSRLPDGILGAIKNKPVQLPDGTILSPSSDESNGWSVHFERSTDNGETWARIPVADLSGEWGGIQPTILLHPDGRIQALCRTRGGRVTETWSSDKGLTWSRPEQTALPHANSGIDAVTLRDGRHLLVYNHVQGAAFEFGPRSPLNVALSSDGKQWERTVDLETEPGEFSYPAVIQGRDGMVHITYTWNRKRIQYVVLDPEKL